MRWARATEVRARKINRIRRIATHQKAAAIKPQPQMTPQGGALSKPPSEFGGGSKPPLLDAAIADHASRRGAFQTALWIRRRFQTALRDAHSTTSRVS